MRGALSRFATLAALMATLAGLGTAQRWWQCRLEAREKAAAAADRAPERELSAQLARLNEELQRLPPESRALVQDVLTAREGERVMNPLLLSLSKLF